MRLPIDRNWKPGSYLPSPWANFGAGVVGGFAGSVQNARAAAAKEQAQKAKFAHEEGQLDRRLGVTMRGQDLSAGVTVRGQDLTNEDRDLARGQQDDHFVLGMQAADTRAALARKLKLKMGELNAITSTGVRTSPAAFAPYVSELWGIEDPEEMRAHAQGGLDAASDENSRRFDLLRRDKNNRASMRLTMDERLQHALDLMTLREFNKAGGQGLNNEMTDFKEGADFQAYMAENAGVERERYMRTRGKFEGPGEQVDIANRAARVIRQRYPRATPEKQMELVDMMVQQIIASHGAGAFQQQQP